MAGKKWLGWVRVDVDKWLIEMRGLTPVTAMAYTRLSFISRNNDKAPGEICTTLRTISVNMAEMEIEETWAALMRLTRVDTIDGTPLIQLEVQDTDSQTGFKRVMSGDRNHATPPEGIVRVRFEWICKWVNELEQEAESERDRKRREKEERERVGNLGKFGKGGNNLEEQEILGKVRNPPKERERESKENIPPIPPKGFFETWFETIFWPAYPRKTAKAKAQAAAKNAWKKADADLIMDGLSRAKQSGQWNRDGGQFIPHAATWLNQERWNDEGEPETGLKNEVFEKKRGPAIDMLPCGIPPVEADE